MSNQPDASRRADDPGVLELLGFGAAPPAPPTPTSLPPHARASVDVAPINVAPITRRELHGRERRPEPTGSAARRVRAIEKTHKKATRTMPRGARIAVSTTAPSSRPPRRHGHAIGSRLLSFGAMIFAGALAVGMSVPANAFDTGSGTPVASTNTEAPVTTDPAQSLAVDSNVAGDSAARDDYEVLSWAEMLRLKYGTRDYNYTVGTGSIRWPFPYAVPISSGYGERAAPCRGCSTIHKGLDLNPGNGAPIYAIADGVVSEAVASGGYGTHVYLTHTINGQSVKTLYAHMQTGSSPLAVGQEVMVGDFIGLVGSTGQATGAHLHLEILVDDVQVDPFAWLKANAN